MSLSRSATIAPIISCLNKGKTTIEKLHSRKITWRAGGSGSLSGKASVDDQNEFLDNVLPRAGKIGEIPEIESIMSRDVNVINSFLRARGFDIQLEEFFDSTSFSTAAVMELLSKWVKPGERWMVHHNREKYMGARVKDDVQFFEAEHHHHPIARLNCSNGDMYYMTRLDEITNGWGEPSNELLMLNVVKSIENSLHRVYDYGGVIFPMIEFEETPDIGWIEGLNECDTMDLFYIRQAVQQTKFKMNHIGAEVKSAAAMGFAASGCSSVPAFYRPLPDLVINKQFLMWVKRPGIELPLFVGHLFPDCWTDPKIDEDQQSPFPFGRSFV